MIDIFDNVTLGFVWICYGAWRALPLLCCVAVIDLLFRRRIAPAYHCVLWLLVLVRMMAPVSFESSLSMQGLLDRCFESKTPAATADYTPDVHTFTDESGESQTRVVAVDAGERTITDDPPSSYLVAEQSVEPDAEPERRAATIGWGTY
jgi:hypothetical protein